MKVHRDFKDFVSLMNANGVEFKSSPFGKGG
jgi:hypothetical protein